MESIFFAGEVKTDTGAMAALCNELRTALGEGNVRLALSIVNTLEARLSAVGKTAELIQMTLETAPSETPSSTNKDGIAP